MSQKKTKFNIVDIIVILILVAGVVFVGVRMLGDRNPADAINDNKTYQVTLRADCVPEDVAAALVQGSACEDLDRTMDLGKLTGFTTGESVTYTTDRDGEWVSSAKSGHVSVTLICELSASETPTGLRLGKYMLNVGRELDICCGMVQLQAVICDIAPAE